MKNYLSIMILIVIGLLAPVANAADQENQIVAACIAQGGNPYAIAACTGGLLTAQEVNTCISNPNQCVGQNNTLRILLTDPGSLAPPPVELGEVGGMRVCIPWC